MSVKSPAESQQPVLPEALARSVNDIALRIAGGGLVAFAVTSWLALLSWQMRDPRLPQGAGKSARNLLGSFGSGLSDMMVQTLGVAVVFALICPMVWGLELLSSVRWIPRFRLKLVSFCGALLMLGGLASGLPLLPGWPLPGGSGGMLGDIVFNLAMTTVPRLGGDKDAMLVLCVLGASGVALLLKALGFGVLHLLRPSAKQTTSNLAAVAPVAAPEAAPQASSTAPAQPAPSKPAAETEPHTPAVSEDKAPAAQSKLTADTSAKAKPIERTASATRAPAEEVPDETEDASRDEDNTANARAFAARFAPGITTGKVAAPKRLAPVVRAIAGLRGDTAFRKPSLNLLRRGNDDRHAGLVDVETGARTLHEVLAAFGVKGEIHDARPGPVVTRYEFEPVRGTKLSRVIGLADDFARELGASAVRVAVTPGRTTIGIEVPNELRDTVMLRDILESETFTAAQMQLPIALGKGIAGEPVVIDLARMPHLLVAGTTGSGKSVGLHAMLLSLLYRLPPSDLRLLLIDPKMLELQPYDRIPHLLNPVITDPQEAALALEWAVSEMEERYKRMARHGVRNIEAFNARVRGAEESGVAMARTVHTGFDHHTGQATYEREQLDDTAMPFIVIVIDELADLMVMAGRQVEGSVQRLAQKARAAGIHLVMATQRPSVHVVTGTIKANLPVRVSYRVASKIDSRTIIGETGAEQLLGSGDLLLATGAGQMLRVHGAYVADAEIGHVAEALRSQGEPHYVEILARPAAARGGKAGRVVSAQSAREAAEAARQEEIYAAAVTAVANDRKVSPGHLHRRLGIGEALAGELIERMEQEGLVGSLNMLGRRAINMKPAPRLATTPARVA